MISKHARLFNKEVHSYSHLRVVHNVCVQGQVHYTHLFISHMRTAVF